MAKGSGGTGKGKSGSASDPVSRAKKSSPETDNVLNDIDSQIANNSKARKANQKALKNERKANQKALKTAVNKGDTAKVVEIENRQKQLRTRNKKSK